MSTSSPSLAEKVEDLMKLKLTDFQRKAIELIESSNRNLIIAAPTGAGKSIIGYAALLEKRGFYLVPLIAIMNEKYRDLTKLMNSVGRTVVVTNRDYRMPYFVVKKADVRVMSPYKFLTYLPSLGDVKGEVVVVDEFHKMSGDPLFEAAITLAKAKGCRIIALSATISDEDLDKLSKWLDAEVVVETKRPVKLVHERVRFEMSITGDVYSVDRVKHGNQALIEAGERFRDRYQATAKLAAVLHATTGKPVIVWAPTRKLVETIAYHIAKHLPENPRLRDVSDKIPSSNPSENLLKYTVKHGVWIHHGGLGYGTRSLIEEKYRELGGVMVTAYTLSHGVNMPGTFLVISTLFDYAGKPLDPTIFHQVSGRAGRPGYDSIGVVLTVIVGKAEERYHEWLLSQVASRIVPKLLNDELGVVKLALPVYAATKSLRAVEKVLRETYSHFDGGLVDNAVKLVEMEVEYYKNHDRRLAVPAMMMGLHHLEYEAIVLALSAPDYEAAIRVISDRACRLLGVGCSDVMDDLLRYGFLASWFGNVQSRPVADAVQTILESGVFWASHVYGWKSPEREKLTELAKKFAYAGNLQVEPLAKTVRIDVLRRMVKAVPAIIRGASEEDAAKLVPVAVKEAYINRKAASRKKVEELVKLTYYAMTGKHPEPHVLTVMMIGVRRALAEVNVSIR